MGRDNVIGLDSYLHLVIATVEELSVMIGTENKAMVRDGQGYGQGYGLLCNSTLQHRRLQLHRRFETLSRVIARMVSLQTTQDQMLIRTAGACILHMRRLLSTNSTLMQNHIDNRERLIAAIMANIDTMESCEATSHRAEQLVCH